MTSSRSRNLFIILMLGALTTVSPFSIDMYLPAFQQMATDLDSTVAKISLSLSGYFIGLAIGQILYGPLLDRFGRKKPLYFGLTLFIAASFAITQVESVEMLIALRVLQALGGSAAGVASTAMVRDFFPVKDTAKILSLLMLILSVSPLLAPTFGSFVTVHLGWQWVFVMLGGITAAIFAITYFFLPEGHVPDKTISLKPYPILRTFWHVLKEPQFHTYAVSGAFSFGGLFIYLAGSPGIFMGAFGVSVQTYGMIFAGLSVGFIGGSQVNILLSKYIRTETIYQTALIMQALVGAVFMIGAYQQWFTLYTAIAMFFLLLSCGGLTYPNAAGLALAPFSKNVGSAAALLGFLQLGIASLGSMGVGILDTKDLFPVTAIMTGSSLIGLTILFAGKRNITDAVPPEENPAAIH